MARTTKPAEKARTKVVVDDVDKALIEALQEDGRLPYTKLAVEVGLSEAAVRQRVQRLVEAGVVQIVAVTDPLTLGFRRMAMIGLKVVAICAPSQTTSRPFPRSATSWSWAARST